VRKADHVHEEHVALTVAMTFVYTDMVLRG
jgi:hypothetical protein